MKESEIFANVIQETDPQKRGMLVEQLCGSNKGLKNRVEKLLVAHDDPQSFFDNPVFGDFSHSENDSAITESIKLKDQVQVGKSIGPYKLLQQIGEGGMGLVYMAEQSTPVKRRVALKVIKPGMDSRQVIARFEAERQSLAMMDHPNIAKVLDAGTTEYGHPFFVMELVNGMPITDYCDQEKLNTAERLSLFTDVCHGAQHAHQKGIIHRDLKPSNILVAEYDGKPVPKIIDFGVAKATGTQLTEKTLFTEFGQVVGTLEYMSPEQARRNQLDIDTRSDIYSLGVILYKLLTGDTPFGQDRFRRAAWDEMMKIIREEEPPLPSLKIGSSQSRDQIAKDRRVEPSRLSSLVRGDLDWIVLKTLAKDRNRRYPSAGELADDVNRHLTQHPVTARPPSFADKCSKYFRRNRSTVVTLSILCIAVLIGTWWIYNSARRTARDISERTNRIKQVMVDAQVAIAKAETTTIGDRASWESADAQCKRVDDLLANGPVSVDSQQEARSLLEDFKFKQNQREIAVQIEEVLIQGATNPDLKSWQRMESQMRSFFLKHGFDLDNDDPMHVGTRIRDHRSAVLWADLLELWIGTKANMASLGGPKITAEIMQPWANAIYVADVDPIRTGIRKFIYTPPRKKETLDKLIRGVDLSKLSPRTLSCLATSFAMVNSTDDCDRIFRKAIQLHPHDLMLAHDYGHSLFHQQRYQEAARIFHRCIAIRSNVAGIWISLSQTLEKLNETKESQFAAEMAKRYSDTENEIESK